MIHTDTSLSIESPAQLKAGRNHGFSPLSPGEGICGQPLRPALQTLEVKNHSISAHESGLHDAVSHRLGSDPSVSSVPVRQNTGDTQVDAMRSAEAQFLRAMNDVLKRSADVAASPVGGLGGLLAQENARRSQFNRQWAAQANQAPLAPTQGHPARGVSDVRAETKLLGIAALQEELVTRQIFDQGATAYEALFRTERSALTPSDARPSASIQAENERRREFDQAFLSRLAEVRSSASGPAADRHDKLLDRSATGLSTSDIERAMGEVARRQRFDLGLAESSGGGASKLGGRA